MQAAAGAGLQLPKRLIFDTTNPIYFGNVKSTLALRNFTSNQESTMALYEMRVIPDGWDVVDRRLCGDLQSNQDDPRRRLPRLLYFDNSQDTVNELRSLISSGVADASLTCALLDSHQGTHTLDSLAQWVAQQRASAGLPNNNNYGRPLARICSADLYDGLFSEVREKICNGESFDAIQAELDARFEPVNVRAHGHGHTRGPKRSSDSPPEGQR